MSDMPEFRLFSDLDTMYSPTNIDSLNDFSEGFSPLNLFNNDDDFDLPELLFPALSEFDLESKQKLDQLPQILSPSPSKHNLNHFDESESPLYFNFNSKLNSDFSIFEPEFSFENFDSVSKEPVQGSVTDTEITIKAGKELCKELINPEPQDSFVIQRDNNQLESVPQPLEATQQSPQLLKLIIQRVHKAQPSKMVAPLSLPEVPFNYVQVPPSGTFCRRISIMKSGGKLSNKILKNNSSEDKEISKNSTTQLEPKKVINTKISIVKCNEELTKVIKIESNSDTEQQIPKRLDEPIKTTITETSQPLKRKCSSVISKSSAAKKLKLKDLPFTSLKRNIPSTTIRRSKPKIKAYELDPLADPTMERCRRNAINAKKNRELKKIRMMELEDEVRIEREAKLRLAGENDELKQRKDELEEKLKHLNSVLQDPSVLSSLLQKVSQQRGDQANGNDSTETLLNATSEQLQNEDLSCS